LPGVPEYFVRIEEQMLAAKITGYSSYAKKEYIGNKGYRKIPQKTLLERLERSRSHHSRAGQDL
jgi:hypothetical protein